jgi:hypothetical protein
LASQRTALSPEEKRGGQMRRNADRLAIHKSSHSFSNLIQAAGGLREGPLRRGAAGYDPVGGEGRG